MPTLSKITPCLWFDTQAEEAATFYTSLFEASRITEVTHYGSAGPRPEGMVMTVEFELAGLPFTALNGGPEFTFDEAVSFQVSCESQEEVDRFSETLTADGGAQGPCGWVKDRFGLSWQINPTRFFELMRECDAEAGQRVVKAMLGMQKIDIAALEAAAAG
jgi:predicted 3-demethylubiquinone-9 3-methyltransferase (glyoxalase superfamily)